MLASLWLALVCLPQASAGLAKSKHPHMCVGVQVLATDAVWEVLSNAEAVAFVSTYCAAAHAELSAADALSWEAQQRLKALHTQVRASHLGRRHMCSIQQIFAPRQAGIPPELQFDRYTHAKAERNRS